MRLHLLAAPVCLVAVTVSEIRRRVMTGHPICERRIHGAQGQCGIETRSRNGAASEDRCAANSVDDHRRRSVCAGGFLRPVRELAAGQRFTS